MTSPISQLQAYLDRPKFADPAVWLVRGLNLSPPDVIARMESVVNEVCNAAMEAHSSGASSQVVVRAMGVALRRWKAHDFETEEREFLCSEVASIAQVLDLRIGPQLNKWLYGPILGPLVNRGH